MSTIILTGASGFLGNIILSNLFYNSNSDVIAVIRGNNDSSKIYEKAIGYLRDTHRPVIDEYAARFSTIDLQDIFDKKIDLEQLKILDIESVIHAAGSVDYFNEEHLTQININLTSTFINFSKKINAKKFVYISTAYSAGYTNELVTESELPEPDKDPTFYTYSKRKAEAIVATSGIKFLIIRPSIVIGHSKYGLYHGKRYGLYQQWMLLERLFRDSVDDEWHLLAQHYPLNLLHVDTFEESFHWAYNHLPKDSYFNVTSDNDVLPTPRELYKLWFDNTLRPKRVIFYEEYDKLPIAKLSKKQRIFGGLIKTNSEIASFQWKFENTARSYLKKLGMVHVNATLESVEVCQSVFLKQSSNGLNKLKESTTTYENHCISC
ncbi:SDR family oxidoreductase [Psychromonas sp. Urea-02u-13]|uniref:SDR family oxidoreductase n=1 Tax=Psychromonas sp. Urea-02u-13 TaxID=2058326 RepID=UPI000C33981E|nr:SDR family oxidoreductase [Psychromonas sp. Urea-02u-13]PKG37881.1 hypothetical protein CXF74_16480 [Psychromonas sp. Urea-02u-13]